MTHHWRDIGDTPITKTSMRRNDCDAEALAEARWLWARRLLPFTEVV